MYIQRWNLVLAVLFAMLATSLAFFERTDCSCTCSKDQKACVKAVPNYLDFNRGGECQCKDGLCPTGFEFNGNIN
jgi:hypothetical protein